MYEAADWFEKAAVPAAIPEDGIHTAEYTLVQHAPKRTNVNFVSGTLGSLLINSQGDYHDF